MTPEQHTEMMEQFLARHNINETELNELVEQSADYNLPEKDIDMTQDQCFDEMGKVLGFTKPEDTGYIAILEKVKELTEENKSRKGLCDHFEVLNKKHYDELQEIKEQNDNLRCDICRYDDVIEAREDDVKMSSALIQKLEEENKKLKNFALDVHNFAYGTKLNDEDIVSDMDFNTIMEKMKKDEEELKEKNDDLQNEVCSYSNAIEEEYVLKTDYEEQEEVLNDYQDIANDYAPNEDKYMNAYGDYIGNPDTLNEYIEELEKVKTDYEEQKEVLNDYQEVIDYMAGHYDCDVYDCHSQWIIEDVKELKKEIEELEKEAHNYKKGYERIKKEFKTGIEVRDKHIEELQS